MNGRQLLHRHRDELHRSAITDDVIASRGYYSAMTPEELLALGFAKSQANAPALVIPVYDAAGVNGLHQIKPDAPRTLNGKIKKYELPAGSRLVLDVPEAVRAVLDDPSIPLLFTEGSKKVDAALSAGLMPIGLIGVWGFRGTGAKGGKAILADFELIALNGRLVYVVFDSDLMVKIEVYRALDRFQAFLKQRGAGVKLIYLPHQPDGSKMGLDDYIAAGHTAADVLALATDVLRPPPAAGGDDGESEAATGPPADPRSLAEVLTAFRKRMHLPDTGAVEVMLGTIAANLMEGDPLWLFLIAGPSSGKTEFLSSLSRLPHIHMASTLTDAALLSGTSKRDSAKDSKGGLLREVGAFGVLVLKDFTSILSMKHENRAMLLAGLREIYDGRYDRHVGVDGGRVLSWSGKLGLVAGVTSAIDSHHAVIALMGERFISYRMDNATDAQALRALRNIGDEERMRAELAEAVAGLFAGLDLPEQPPALGDEEANRLVALASLSARARSAVERDGRTREIFNIPAPEAPARLALALRRLHAGLLTIGVEGERTWELLEKVAFDSIPELRRRIVHHLFANPRETTSAIAVAARYPTDTARHALEDLAAHDVVDRYSGGAGKADSWSLTTWASGQYRTAKEPCTKNTPPGVDTQQQEEQEQQEGALSLSLNYPLPMQGEESYKVSGESPAPHLCAKCGGECNQPHVDEIFNGQLFHYSCLPDEAVS